MSRAHTLLHRTKRLMWTAIVLSLLSGVLLIKSIITNQPELSILWALLLVGITLWVSLLLYQTIQQTKNIQKQLDSIQEKEKDEFTAKDDNLETEKKTLKQPKAVANEIFELALQTKLNPADAWLSAIGKKLPIVQGVFYQVSNGVFEAKGLYAYVNEELPTPFKTGETLPGQIAKEQKLVIIDNIPEDYLRIESGLGASKPASLLLAPVSVKNQTIAVIELASFEAFTPWHKEVMTEFCNLLSAKLSKA